MLTILATTHSFVQARGAEPQLIDIDGTVFVQLALFLLLLLILTRLFFKPFLELKDAREKVTDGPRHDAKAMDGKSLELAEKYEKAVAAARQTGADANAVSRADSQKREREIREKARTETETRLTEARAKLKIDTETARATLGTQVDALAKDMAKRLLGRSL
jgi:F-type H+-transporting ATPase subunit b